MPDTGHNELLKFIRFKDGVICIDLGITVYS